MDIVYKDLEQLAKTFAFKDEIRNKNILITGGTGLIGSLTVRFLDVLNTKYQLNIGISASARNKEKAENVSLEGHVNWLYTNFKSQIDANRKFDYIIHTACPTQSSYLSTHPVEVIEDTVLPTMNLCKYCRDNGAKMVFLSSIEIYGQIFDNECVTENDYGYLEHLNPRSCYPQSKKLIESMISAYAYEYGADVKIARLTQTFGAGISRDDNRVFAQFAWSAINGTDIVLHTEGLSSKSYIYTTDAINALFYILLLGKSGEAYNVANPDSYISIYNLATFIKEKFNQRLNIKIVLGENKGYAPDTKVNLDVTKLKDLGWNPKYDLFQMFDHLIIFLSM